MTYFFHTLSLHHQVCLDSKLTTEKELDTVEVLKAIQKAKEVKDRKSGGNKKVRSVTLSREAVPGGTSLYDDVVENVTDTCAQSFRMHYQGVQNNRHL